MSDLSIEVTNLSKKFGKTTVLSGINLRCEKGKIYGLLGPNGSGKSTLIKVLVGLLHANAGQVRVLGLDPIKDSGKLRSKLGYMPQSPALYETLSARDNIAFFAKGRATSSLKNQINKVLNEVALVEVQNKPIFTFSGGMKQRVSLAVAMVHEPEVLFLDEPTAGVDPKLKGELWGHFRALSGRGVSIFISTHLMDEALLCDELTILRSGKVLDSASPKAILSQGSAEIEVEENGQKSSFKVSSSLELPKILNRFGLRESVSSIEIREPNLEEVILKKINHD